MTDTGTAPDAVGGTDGPAADALLRTGRFFTRRSYVTPAALAGTPAIAVPCGFTRSGLPISVQLIARRFDEATLLRAAHAYEQASGWSKRRPPETA